MTHIYDISTPIRNGGVVYPGNPDIVVAPQLSVAEGASANVSILSMGSHTATHVDSARHFFDDGQSVDELPLDTLIGPALLIRFDDSVRAVGAQQLADHKIDGYTRVLLATRNSRLLRDGMPFDREYTYLAPDGAEYLAERGVRLVGIDYLSIEQFRSGHHKTHRTLLGRDIVIVEGLDLTDPPAGEYEFICLPLRIENGDGAPARAVLIDKRSEQGNTR